jgi:putative Mg2+ transporter-C (MgtC) family protein
VQGPVTWYRHYKTPDDPFTPSQMYLITNSEIIIRLLLAAVLGGIVGWERQRREGFAGLRTHMLVCLGSALVMIISAFGFSDIIGHPQIVLDPSRMAAQVISGIGFLGAGSILVLRQQVVRGLTTAAGIWTVAAVGLAVGGGLYLAATITTVIIVVILAIIKPLERRFFSSQRSRSVQLTIERPLVNLSQVEVLVQENGIEIMEIAIHPSANADQDELRLRFHGTPSSKKIMALLDSIRNVPGISEISFRD